MTTDQIKALTDEVKYALNRAEDIASENRMLKRVLKQAVLTHAGELRVDPSLADQAKRDCRLLDFSQGGVRLLEDSAESPVL